jgi:hypothetical protein
MLMGLVGRIYDLNVRPEEFVRAVPPSRELVFLSS